MIDIQYIPVHAHVSNHIYIYIIIYTHTRFTEGSLEAKFPTIWTDGQALQLGRSSDVEKMRYGESQKREDAKR